MSIDLETRPAFNRIADFFAAEPEIANAEPKPESERSPKGTFRNGNRGGPGNPYARRVAKLRQAMLEECREEDLRSITRVMIDRANQGDTAAARLVFQYVLGKPSKPSDPDRIDADELDVLKGIAVPEAVFAALLNHSVPADTVCKMLQGLWPLLLKALGKKVEEQAEERRKRDEELEQDTEACEALPGEEKVRQCRASNLEPLPEWVAQAEKERAAREAKENAKPSTNGCHSEGAPSPIPAGTAPVSPRQDANPSTNGVNSADQVAPSSRGPRVAMRSKASRDVK
jgi:hypothetical protein